MNNKLCERAKELWGMCSKNCTKHPMEHIIEIEQALQQTRDEALEEAADICRKSVRMSEPGSATMWVECDKNPFELASEISSLKFKREEK